MCRFCAEHGEGKAWYLEAANHSRELMERLRTEERLRRHARTFERSTIRLFSLYDRLEPVWRLLPPLRRLAHAWATRRQLPRHFGQVLTREHAHRVFSLAGRIVRLPCTCRRFVRGKPEARYCFGLGFDPHRVYGGLPGYRGDFEELTPREASALTDRFQREEGLVHTVWTMPTPFVSTLCNCSRADCGAFLTTYGLGIDVLFPGHQRARVSPDLCRGCRGCLKACPFGALAWGATPGKVVVLATRCQGCGVCRDACPDGALTMEETHLAPPSREPAHAGLHTPPA